MNRRLRTATILGAASVLASLGAAGVGRLAPVPAAGAAPPASVTALVAWGDNSTGELGNGTTSNADTPMTVSLPAGVVPDAVAGGGGGFDGIPAEYAGYAIGSDKKLYAWGDNSTGQLGDGSTTPTSSDTPVVVALPSGVTPVAISAAQGAAYAIGSDGNLYAWGDGGLDKLGDGSMTSTDTPVLVSLPTGVTAKAVAAGYESAYAIGSDGNLYAWGHNGYGELGNGNTNDSDTPVVVSLPAGVKPLTIAGGGGVGYAIGSDSNLYSWGLNTGDELGDGSSSGPQSCMGNSCSDTPVLVSLPAGVTAKAVTGGGGFAHAIGSDGNLYGWGSGSGGQLGVTDTTPTPLLVTLAPGVTPTAISDNLQTGYAIGSDGNVYAWGYGADGERGNGSTVSGSPPVVVSLPPGSVPLSLGPEPGSSAGYAIVSAPPTAPLVTSQPQPQTVFVGESATFTAAAGGLPAPSVQWQVSTDGGATFAPVSGGTSDTLTVATTTIGQNGDEYEAVFSNGTAPDATTNPALLTVNPDVAPSITLQPTDQTGITGDTVSFTATAGGHPAPSVQWQVSTDGGATFAPVSGGTSDTLTVAITTIGQNGDEYEAVFTNAVSSATTDPATLSVTPTVAPVVTTNPLSQTASYDDTLTFSAAASGTPTPSVHWQLSVDGGSTWMDQPQVTADPVTTGPLTLFENGWEVRAVFSNVAGAVTTNPATITVTVPPPTTTVGLPSNGSTVSGDAWLDALAQSPIGVASVRFEVSGGTVSDLAIGTGTDTQWGWIGAWDTTNVPNGSYQLQSVVTDKVGTSATSAGVTVTVDNMPLQTQIFIPSDGATLSGSSAVLDASASGTADITGVQFVVSGGSLSDHVVGTATPTLYGWIAEWDTTTVPNGAYTLESVATETGGTTATSSPIHVTVDNPAP